jgi:hypothetical protein
VLAVGLVAWPLLRRAEPEPPPDPRADERARVAEELERSLAAIREIEFDHRAGNLSDEDFAALDAAERARAVELLRRRDELGAG